MPSKEVLLWEKISTIVESVITITKPVELV